MCAWWVSRSGSALLMPTYRPAWTTAGHGDPCLGYQHTSILEGTHLAGIYRKQKRRTLLYGQVLYTVKQGRKWWRQGGSNPQPRHCERRALPIELCPHGEPARPNPRAALYPNRRPARWRLSSRCGLCGRVFRFSGGVGDSQQGESLGDMSGMASQGRSYANMAGPPHLNGYHVAVRCHHSGSGPVLRRRVRVGAPPIAREYCAISGFHPNSSSLKVEGEYETP